MGAKSSTRRRSKTNAQSGYKPFDPCSRHQIKLLDTNLPFNLATIYACAVLSCGDGFQGNRFMSEDNIIGFIRREVAREERFLEKKAKRLYGPGVLPFIRLKIQEAKWTFAKQSKRLWGLLRRNTDAAQDRDNLVRLMGGVLPSLSADAERAILIDVTDTMRCKKPSGIQRVVKHLALAAMRHKVGIPVYIKEGRVFTFYSESLFPMEIVLRSHHKFLIGDRSWEYQESCKSAMRRASSSKAKNVILLYDIIALKYPDLFPTTLYPETYKVFGSWVQEVVLKSDAIVAISRSAALDLKSYAKEQGLSFPPHSALGWSHLGAFERSVLLGKPSQLASSISRKSAPIFLSVGSVEIRKGISFVIDCFERLWSAGVEVGYVICGRETWGAESIAERIRQHSQYGKQLFWLEDASDRDLECLYKSSHALIFASVTEGYGLPIVEAADHGLSAIISDIPVFRELGGKDVTYFEPVNEAGLLMRIRESIEAGKLRSSLVPQTLDDAMLSLLQLVADDGYQMKAA